MMWRSRSGLLQKAQGSTSVMLLQIEQYVTRSFTARSASTSRSASSRVFLRMWNARRCAPLGPMPGRRCSCSMRRMRGSGSGIGGSAAAILQPWDLETSHHASHRLAELLFGLALGIVDRRHDQVLQHLDVFLRDDFRIDLQRLDLLRAVDDDGDHAAAGGRFDLEL